MNRPIVFSVAIDGPIPFDEIEHVVDRSEDLGSPSFI